MPSHFSRTQLFTTLWTVTCQAPLFIGFSRQKYWNGLPCHPPGDLPIPGIEPASLVSPALAGRFFTSEPPGKPLSWENWSQFSMCSTIVGGKQFPLKGKHRPYEQRWTAEITFHPIQSYFPFRLTNWRRINDLSNKMNRGKFRRLKRISDAGNLFEHKCFLKQ